MRVSWIALLLLSAALAGCSGDDAPEEDHDDDGMDHDDTSMDHGETNETAAPSQDVTTTHELVFAGAPINGSVNLTVDFTGEVLVNETTHIPGDAELGIPDENSTVITPYEGNLTWTLAFGDGDNTAGDQTDFGVFNHTYVVGGNFTATLTVTPEGQDALAQALNVTVTVPDGAAFEPVLEFGAVTFGCIMDVETIAGLPVSHCVNYLLGPGAPLAIDGTWVAIDERYWGLSFTSTLEGYTPLPAIGGGDDSDCLFIGEDEATILGDGHNGGDVCQGQVPDGTAWIFIFPWAGPADGGTIIFG